MANISKVITGAAAGIASTAGAVAGAATGTTGSSSPAIGLNDIVSFFTGSFDWGSLITGALNSVWQLTADSFVASLKTLLTGIVINPATIMDFTFVSPLYKTMQTAGYAVLILIVAWQTFKAIFTWAGFEADEPWRIAVKAIIFGFLLFFGKDILLKCANIGFNIMELVFSTQPGKNFGQELAGMIDSSAVGNVSLFSINALIIVYFLFRLVKAAYKMVERLMLTVILIIVSPLAFASGASSSTKGFLVGFVRTFTGNIVIQIAQTVCLSAIILYQHDTASSDYLNNVLTLFVLIALFKITDKLEEIVRDMSVSVGFGRDYGAGMVQKATTALYSSQMLVSVMRTVRGVV